MREERSTVAQTVIFVISIALLISGIGLNIGGLISPSWQVVDIREFRAIHHHGLWQDCSRPNRHSSLYPSLYDDNIPLSCTYKFDYSASEVIGENLRDIDNSAAGESEHHQFFGWQKVVLISAGISLTAGILGACTGLCASCYSACAILYDILVFVAVIFAVAAAGIFFFAAHRVDSRFVQGLVGTYEQEIGFAFYLYGSGTILLLFSFILSIVATYRIYKNSNNRLNIPLRELAPLYNSHVRDTTI
ncbi:unnamed protein product [Dracunculus medinensis]|uniref:Clc-like protein n=1 Tax=Dracunculus medinensis TaxID=318479 RepID=A0A0N4ULU6_DRAME|nr:unnamed protein product [Dracunculus medinensis]